MKCFRKNDPKIEFSCESASDKESGRLEDSSQQEEEVCGLVALLGERGAGGPGGVRGAGADCQVCQAGLNIFFNFKE